TGFRCRGLRGRLIGERLETQQGRPGTDLASDSDVTFPQYRPERRTQHGLHLHAFQHEHRRVRLDLRPCLVRCGHHQRALARTNHATLVPVDAMRDPVDLDEMRRTMRVADKTVVLSVHGELATAGIEPFDTYRQRTGRLAVTRADAETEHVLTDPCHHDA